MNRKIFGIVFLFHSLVSRVHAECYSEYWQQFFWKLWENDSFALGTYIKIDSGNHFKNIRSYQINEQFLWKAAENLGLELHYAYIHGRSVVPDSIWHWQHRLEIEVNPSFRLPGDCLLQTRNRLEIRRFKNQPVTKFRLRQRTMLIVPFESEGTLKSFSVYNELFYNASEHYFNQDRLCPCQLTISLSKKNDLNVFFLMEFFTHETIWHRSAILGTQLNF